MNFKSASLPSLTLNETTFFKVSFFFCKTVTLCPSRSHYFVSIFKGSNESCHNKRLIAISFKRIIHPSYFTEFADFPGHQGQHALYPVLLMVFV